MPVHPGVKISCNMVLLLHDPSSFVSPVCYKILKAEVADHLRGTVAKGLVEHEMAALQDGKQMWESS